VAISALSATLLPILVSVMGEDQPLTQATYRNPVIPVVLSSPSVIRHEGLFYLYPNGEVDQNSGTRAFFSADLVHWQRGPIVLQLDTGEQSLWPDVWRDPDSGRFLLDYTHLTARHETPTWTINVADSAGPLGPFETVRELIDGAIAPHRFRDEDGRHFLYFVRTSPWAICVQPMVSPTEVDGKPEVILRPEGEWVATGQRKFSSGRYAGPFLIGDPWIIKPGRRYHLLYSGGAPESPESSIGCATADDPLGPFTRAPANPILLRSDAAPGPGGGSVIRTAFQAQLARTSVGTADCGQRTQLGVHRCRKSRSQAEAQLRHGHEGVRSNRAWRCALRSTGSFILGDRPPKK
jgi:beta-xylosidase